MRVEGLQYLPGQPIIPGDVPSKMKLPKYVPPKKTKKKGKS